MAPEGLDQPSFTVAGGGGKRELYRLKLPLTAHMHPSQISHGDLTLKRPYILVPLIPHGLCKVQMS